MKKIVECVPNFSEGKDKSIIKLTSAKFSLTISTAAPSIFAFILIGIIIVFP